MSLLMKAGAQLLLKSCRRPFCSAITELPSRTQDPLMVSLKTASSTSAILSTVQQHLPSMDHRQKFLALKAIYELQRSTCPDETPETLLKNPGFVTLCQNIKKDARALDVNDVIDTLKILCFLQLPVDSMIVQTMLQLIRSNINFVSTRQVIFLDFLLSKFESNNHLVDALKMALPLVFQIHLPLEIDNQDLPLLRDMLLYCCRNNLPDRCINNVVTGLLLNDQAIDTRMAKLLVWAMCNINCTEEVYPTRVQLFHKCCNILAKSIDQLRYKDVLKTAAKLKTRIIHKHPEYYHEALVDAMAEYVVKNDVNFDKGLLIARVLSRIAHTNLTLVEYICHQAASEPTTLTDVQTNILFSFINCLSNNNYLPEESIWSELKRQISLNPVMEGCSPALPWTKFCLEAASLGYYEDKILEKVFSEEFLGNYLSRKENTLDYLQLLTLYEAVNTLHTKKYSLSKEILDHAKSLYPIHSMADVLVDHLRLELGGAEYVAKNVVLPNGIVVDCFICLKDGAPLRMTTNKDHIKTSLESLSVPEQSISVCILNFNQGCYSMNSNRLRGTFRLVLDILDNQGYAALAVNLNDWINLPERQRAPYLMREISYKCEQMGVKLGAS